MTESHPGYLEVLWWETTWSLVLKNTQRDVVLGSKSSSHWWCSFNGRVNFVILKDPLSHLTPVTQDAISKHFPLVKQENNCLPLPCIHIKLGFQAY